MWITTGFPQALYLLTVVMMAGSFGIAMAPFGIKPWHGLLLPLTIGLLVYIQCRAMMLTLWNGGITWRGTFYPLTVLRNK